MTPHITVKNVLDFSVATERKHLDSSVSPSSCYVSLSLYFMIFHFTYVTILFTGMLIGYADCMLASSQHNLYDIYLLLCVQ